MAKCAEYGLPHEAAGALLKEAAPPLLPTKSIWPAIGKWGLRIGVPTATAGAGFLAGRLTAGGKAPEPDPWYLSTPAILGGGILGGGLLGAGLSAIGRDGKKGRKDGKDKKDGKDGKDKKDGKGDGQEERS